MLRQFVFLHSQRVLIFRWTLLSMALLDELITGFPLVGLPLLRDQLGLSYEQVGLIFSVGSLSAMLLEPIINILSDRGSKRLWVLGGLLILVVAFTLAGSAHSLALLLLAFTLFYPADGAAVGLSQATLIDLAPQDSAQTMTSWTLMSSVGDLLSPLAVAAIVGWQLSWLTGSAWATLCWLGAGLWLVAALAIWPQRFPHPANTTSVAEDTPRVGMLAGLREALRDLPLLRWAAISLVTTMMDEIFIGFAALYLRDVLHANEATIGLMITGQMVGTLLGLLILGPLLKHIAPQRLLLGLAVLTLIGVVCLLSTHSIWFAAFALFVIDLGAAGWYPIAQAQAYARLPGRSGTVRAVIGLGAPFEVALPGVVGVVAGRFGLLAGLGLLGLAPVLVLVLIPWRRK